MKKMSTEMFLKVNSTAITQKKITASDSFFAKTCFQLMLKGDKRLLKL